MKRIIILISILISFGINSFAKPGDTIKINNDVFLLRICDSVYMHLTYDIIGSFGRAASNGMIVIKNGQAIMIDTPVSDNNTEAIAGFLKNNWGVSLKLLIVGHYHIDCMGGIGYIHSEGIKSIANTRTIEKCREFKLEIPKESFDDSLVFDFNSLQVVCRYFGGGHTGDNITVWFPEYKVLFGGCLIKSANASNLGNLADAVVNEWYTTVNKIRIKYPEIKYIVPGHGNLGGPELLNHTLDLVKKYSSK